MNSKDVGIKISKKPLKENMAIITVFTENHGLYSCVISGSSNQFGSINQQKVILLIFWQARLHEHLGMSKCELIESYAGLLITNKIKLYAFNSITVLALLRLHFMKMKLTINFYQFFNLPTLSFLSI